jgi:hypothetical protein
MTEDDARRRWCPMVRYSSDEEATCNRDHGMVALGLMNRAYFCIASDCMMWQWKILVTEEDGIEMPLKSHGGYCGLVK